jgi:hypothetical protein
MYEQFGGSKVAGVLQWLAQVYISPERGVVGVSAWLCWFETELPRDSGGGGDGPSFLETGRCQIATIVPESNHDDRLVTSRQLRYLRRKRRWMTPYY